MLGWVSQDLLARTNWTKILVSAVLAVVVSSVGLGEPRSAGKNQLDVNLGLCSVSSGSSTLSMICIGP